MTAASDPVLARRAATADICLKASNTVTERIVSEATRAANLARLRTGRRATLRRRYPGEPHPHIVERGLVAIAFRVARELVRRGAPEKGFTPDELEQEFIAFADQLEGLLFKT